MPSLFCRTRSPQSCLVFAFFLIVASAPLAFPQRAAGDAPAQTIDKALNYVADAGQQWISDRGCVSCHQIPPMIWAHHAAIASGVPGVDREPLEQWTDWSTQVVNFVKPHQKADQNPKKTMSGNIDTMAQLLLAIPDEKNPAPWRKQFANALVANQAADGSWRACGQLPAQRRPKNETTATTTLWTMLALLSEDVPFNRDPALQFVDQVQSPESTEYLAVRLLVADRLKQPSRDEWRQRLLAHQNKDGGWGWRIDEDSNALGTSYALYALAKTDASPEVIARATRYLDTTQQPDGSWSVPGTKTSAKGEATDTAIDWATAWAATAMSVARKQYRQ